MGTVFKARHVDLGRFVALKIVNPTMVCDSDTIGRFEREAQILSNLSHPHIGRFFRFGISPEKLPYIEMEFIEGESLRQLLNKVDCLAWSRAVRIITQVCEAMDYAHKNAVLHRDLKPNNIVICTDAENEVVKVIDFGLAKLIARDEREFQKLTQTGTLLGSVQYMSPELCAGITLDQRADIYSLGCVLYECITGHLPHESDNPIGLMHKHVNEAVKKPSLLIKTQLPDRLDEVILKAVERDVLLRYQSMAEFRDDLLLVLSGEASRTTGGRSVTSALKKGLGDTSPISKLKLLLLLVSLLLLSLAIGAYYFAFTGRGLIHAYQIVAPYTSKQDRKKVDKFFSNRIEQFGAVADKEQFSSILYLSQRVSLDRVELALQFAKKELERNHVGSAG